MLRIGRFMVNRRREPMGAKKGCAAYQVRRPNARLRGVRRRGAKTDTTQALAPQTGARYPPLMRLRSGAAPWQQRIAVPGAANRCFHARYCS
jgi:hypothetical protein